VVAVNDAFAVGRRQLEIIHSQTHVQQFPQVTCTKWILQEYSDTSYQYFHRFLIITLTFTIKKQCNRQRRYSLVLEFLHFSIYFLVTGSEIHS